MSEIASVEVEMPSSLCVLAGAPHRLRLDVTGDVTLASLVDALERRFPQLSGCLREHGTGRRRPFIRFFGCGQDLSHLPMNSPLPAAVAAGREPLLIIAAVAGG